MVPAHWSEGRRARWGGAGSKKKRRGRAVAAGPEVASGEGHGGRRVEDMHEHWGGLLLSAGAALEHSLGFEPPMFPPVSHVS